MKKNGEFKKVIGLFGGISLVAGMTIGSGIYYLGSYVLERTGFSFSYALLCWMIGGVVSILGGLCFAELGASRPVAGGMTVYLSEAYHPAVGFINGFSLFILTASGSTASLAMAAMSQLQSLFLFSDNCLKLLSIAVIVLFTALNLRGAKESVSVQNLTMIVRRDLSNELNLISWNDGAPKYDIRDWAPEHEKVGKGVTLTKEEAAALFELLKEVLSK